MNKIVEIYVKRRNFENDYFSVNYLDIWHEPIAISMYEEDGTRINWYFSIQEFDELVEKYQKFKAANFGIIE